MVSRAQSLLDINSWSLTGRSSSLEAWCGNFQSIPFFISFLGSCVLTASVVKCQSIASIDPRLTLDQHLDWHPIDAQLTSRSILSNLDWPCQRSLDSYTNWQIVNWLRYQSTFSGVSAKIHQLLATGNWDVDQVLTEHQSRCLSHVNQGSVSINSQPQMPLVHLFLFCLTFLKLLPVIHSWCWAWTYFYFLQESLKSK